MKEQRPILLAAGGTGGHLFPAEALANALARRSYEIELVTDDRALNYGAHLPRPRRAAAQSRAKPMPL